MKRREIGEPENTPKKKKLDEGSPDENAEDVGGVENGTSQAIQLIKPLSNLKQVLLYFYSCTWFLIKLSFTE